MNLEAIWIFVDGLESELQVFSSNFSDDFQIFLSTLSLFDIEFIKFHFFLPSHLEPIISLSSGTSRRRLTKYELDWSQKQVEIIVNKRLAYAFDEPRFTLKKLVSSKELIPWLEKSGGTSPRIWFDLIEPYIKYYLDNKLEKPISHET